MKNIKTILFATVAALGIAACHEDRAQVQHPASSSYAAPDQTQTAPAPVEGTYNSNATTTPDVNGTDQSGAAVQANPDMNTAPAQQQQTTSPSAGNINSTDNASGNNSNNMQRNGQRTNGAYGNSKNSVPSSTNGTNVNTDSDMDRTGNSGTTKEGNPGTATPDR
jgi:hypothetical protein